MPIIMESMWSSFMFHLHWNAGRVSPKNQISHKAASETATAWGYIFHVKNKANKKNLTQSKQKKSTHQERKAVGS